MWISFNRVKKAKGNVVDLTPCFPRERKERRGERRRKKNGSSSSSFFFFIIIYHRRLRDQIKDRRRRSSFDHMESDRPIQRPGRGPEAGAPLWAHKKIEGVLGLRAKFPRPSPPSQHHPPPRRHSGKISMRSPLLEENFLFAHCCCYMRRFACRLMDACF